MCSLQYKKKPINSENSTSPLRRNRRMEKRIPGLNSAFVFLTFPYEFSSTNGEEREYYGEEREYYTINTNGEEREYYTIKDYMKNKEGCKKKKEMAVIQRLLEDSKKDVDVIQKLLDSKTVEIENLSKELGNTRTLLNTTKTENEDSKKDVDVIQKLLDSKTVEIENLSKELGNTRTLLNTTKTENENLSKELGNTRTLLNTTKTENEDLRAKIDEVDSSKMLQIKRAKSRMREKLDSLVDGFQGRLVYFVGFMGYLLKLPCKTRYLFDELIGLGCVGVFGLYLLFTYRSWNIYREFYSDSKILKQSISKTTITATQPILDTNTLPFGHHSTPPSSALSSNSDLEWSRTSLESKVNKYREWFYHAWRTLLSMVIIMIFFFTFNYFVARYIYTEGCDVPGPTPSPSTSKLTSEGIGYG